ncbi:MAG: hypothetical protein WB729_18925 [Candidatus Sulfotelmatobacter sp.]
MFRFYERLEAGQIGTPEAAIVFEPGIYSAKRFGVELIDAVAAFAVFENQLRAAQKTEMLRDSWTRNRKSLGNMPSRLTATAKQVENGAPCGIG